MRPSAYKFDEQTIRYRHALKKISGFLKKYIFLIILSIAMWVFFADFFDKWNGAYSDADGYMRAIRMYHWLLAPSFLEQPIAESNYPFGEIIHWTRPMDILWLLTSLPFWHMHLPLKETIFISGTFIAPILGMLSSVALLYGLKRTFNIYLALFGCIIFFINASNFFVFPPSRPDHHALIVCLVVYAFSLVLCWLKKRQNRYLRLLGLTLALATFTAIEGYILYALFLAFFIYLYVIKNLSLIPAVKISKYFAWFLTLFWFLNPPYQGWLYPDNGRISVLFVTASWLVFGMLWLLEKSHLHIAKIKFLSLLSFSLGILLLLVIIFGAEILHPQLSSEIREIWSNRINEMASFNQLPWYNNVGIHIFPFIALLINFMMLKKHSYKRLMTFNLILGLPLFILSLNAVRFSVYQLFYTILPFLVLLDYLYKKSDYYKNKKNDFPCFIWGIMFLITFFPYLANIPFLLYAPGKASIPFSPHICRLVKETGGTLVTHIFLTPKYIWSCEINTVSTPYHRNIEGITDAHKLLFSESNNDIIPLILKHQITQILLFDNNETNYFKITDENQNRLYYRLLKNRNIPPYLSEIKTNTEHAHLFEVKI